MICPPHHRRCFPPTIVPADADEDRKPVRAAGRPRVLITAGPTHEPIDAVRFIGNRSSGRMGVALARAAALMGWETVLLLGPVSVAPPDSEGVAVHRFTTCEDLRALLGAYAPSADILIMAAAVADFRPRPNPAMSGGKFRRSSGPIALELEPTPDLLAEASRSRRPGQLFVGFALEPRADLLAAAQAKLTRKRIDLVVANPLETMDSPSVEAKIVAADGSLVESPGVMPKPLFAPWLLGHIEARYRALEGANTDDADGTDPEVVSASTLHYPRETGSTRRFERSPAQAVGAL